MVRGKPYEHLIGFEPMHVRDIMMMMLVTIRTMISTVVMMLMMMTIISLIDIFTQFGNEIDLN